MPSLMFAHSVLLVTATALVAPTRAKETLPQDFVRLRQVAPSIEQDMRYATPHNFTGAVVEGYEAAECWLTAAAAQALLQAQAELNVFGLGLKVYDCYRPRRAVAFFSRWAEDRKDTRMAQEFYPRTLKSKLHAHGYIAHQSGHSRGSTVDLTLVPYPAVAAASYDPQRPLVPCIQDVKERFADNSLDMGTGFDCLDIAAHTQYPNLSSTARRNRLLLRQVMRRYGLINYPKEWWHYTYYNEPYRNQSFDAVITEGREPGKSE